MLEQLRMLSGTYPTMNTISFYKPGLHPFLRLTGKLRGRTSGPVSPKKNCHSIGRSLSGSKHDLSAMLLSLWLSKQLIKTLVRLPA